MRRKYKLEISFEKQLIIIALIITSLPLIFSYGNLLVTSLENYNDNNKESLIEIGKFISSDERVVERLTKKENDGVIQDITSHLINSFENVDIIVVADMNGEKYSHLKTEQIGEIFIGDDKGEVLLNGKRYFSIKEGSVGVTLRWFEPIYNKEKQVGFVMVGKSYRDILKITNVIKIKYFFQAIIALTIAIVISKLLARRVKSAMHNLEPYQISKLYREKKVILNTVSEGIIALNRNFEVTEINSKCYDLIKDFKSYDVVKMLEVYIKNKSEIDMKEFAINGEKIFISIKNITEENIYLGAVITLIDSKNINRVAREITGIDEVIKNLRANIHEFKNNLYVILGLLQIKKYNEAESYILKLKEVEKINTNKFNEIDDYYVRALLLSRELVAKERKITLSLEEGSFLFKEHKIVSSLDLVTIIGNLIENAFEACSQLNDEDRRVSLTFFEDEDLIEIQVLDNGKKINGELKEKIFEYGISSKGDNRGTGLSLVKNRVELYKGSIEIDEFKDSKSFIVMIYKGES
ncbi:MAG: GHKL domain-containing protein [Clostridium sp.]